MNILKAMMEWLRLALRLGTFSLFLAATGLLATGLLATEILFRTSIDRAPWTRFCFRWACRCLGLDIHIHGARPSGNALFAGNHISWTDIPVLGSVQPVRFLSKSEVAHWPLIGWLARQGGTLFIKRGGGQARQIKAGIAEKLRAGESVLIFPEGTTSAGLTVLPFHGLLLKAAAESAVPIQPVTISYRRNNHPDHLAPFIGDDEFHSHLITLLRKPSPRVDVFFHPPVIVSPETGTKELSRQLHGTILGGLARIHAGEFDPARTGPVRTGGVPGLFRPR